MLAYFKRESRLNEPAGYPIKEFGYDKSGMRKNLIGRCKGIIENRISGCESLNSGIRESSL